MTLVICITILKSQVSTTGNDVTLAITTWLVWNLSDYLRRVHISSQEDNKDNNLQPTINAFFPGNFQP